jgi:hypothetical protein
VEALILATRKDQLLQKARPKRKPKGLSLQNVGQMEQEMELLQRDLKTIETIYGKNVLCLTVARSYIRKLLENPEIKKFLTAHYADVLSELTVIVESETL